MAVPGSVREGYLERMQGLIAFYRRELGLAGIDYCLLDTSQPLELGLMAYLMTRRRALVMFGVSFLSPLFLIGAIAAAVPILLHLFHRRTEVVVDFPAVRLLTRAPVQQHRRRRLRELMLLALRVAALVLLAGVVRAAVPRRRDAGRRCGAGDRDRGRYVDEPVGAAASSTRARRPARGAVDAAPASHAVALVAFADAATTVVDADDRSRRRSSRAIARDDAGRRRARAIGTALARAAKLIGARDGPRRRRHRSAAGRMGRQRRWRLPDGVDGRGADRRIAAAGNLAVTAAERRDRRVVASIQNYGLEPKTAPVPLIGRRQGGRQRQRRRSRRSRRRTWSSIGAAAAARRRGGARRRRGRVTSATTAAPGARSGGRARIAVIVADPTGAARRAVRRARA